MKQHVDIGADILSLVEFPYPVVPIVRGHHESWDGSGYPRGLEGARHSDRRAHSVGRRLLRRADLRSAVPPADDRRRGDRDPARAAGQDVRPATSSTRSSASIATSRSAARDAPEHREVMQRVTQSRQDAGAVARSGAGSVRQRAEQPARVRQPVARGVGRRQHGRRARARLASARRRRARRDRRLVRARTAARSTGRRRQLRSGGVVAARHDGRRWATG